MRKNISTGTPSEIRVGYSRAVHIDNRIYVSGTTAVDKEGKAIGRTVYKQTNFIFDKIKSVLEKEEFSEKNIVSITVYLVNIKQLPDFDKAFWERFSSIKPTCTLVGVKELHAPDLLIEIECIAEKTLPSRK